MCTKFPIENIEIWDIFSWKICEYLPFIYTDCQEWRSWRFGTGERSDCRTKTSSVGINAQCEVNNHFKIITGIIWIVFASFSIPKKKHFIIYKCIRQYAKIDFIWSSLSWWFVWPDSEIAWWILLRFDKNVPGDHSREHIYWCFKETYIIILVNPRYMTFLWFWPVVEPTPSLPDFTFSQLFMCIWGK